MRQQSYAEQYHYMDSEEARNIVAELTARQEGVADSTRMLLRTDRPNVVLVRLSFLRRSTSICAMTNCGSRENRSDCESKVPFSYMMASPPYTRSCVDSPNPQELYTYPDIVRELCCDSSESRYLCFPASSFDAERFRIMSAPDVAKIVLGGMTDHKSLPNSTPNVTPVGSRKMRGSASNASTENHRFS